MFSLSVIEHGTPPFPRTVCACARCRSYCKTQPGGLIPADLERLCPAGVDMFAWAEEHLRASCGVMARFADGVTTVVPTLVPRRQEDQRCHWFQADGKCAVHGVSPYSCAYLDANLSEAEGEKRKQYSVKARLRDLVDDGVYTQIWRHLQTKGLVTDTHDNKMRSVRAQRLIIRHQQTAKKRAERKRKSR